MIIKTHRMSPGTVLSFLLILLMAYGCTPSHTVKSTPALAEPKIAAIDAIPASPAKVKPAIIEPITVKPVSEDAQQTAVTPTSLWDRLFQNYQFPETHNARVQKEIDWLLKHPQHLQKVQQHAEPYLYYIVEQLEQRQLPGELAFLPAVESAYRPFAYSHGRAAGLWQFIPSTGKAFGLKQTWWYDGRRDITESTTAALDYLSQLHQRKGDWFLALASYNAGAGNVRKAIRHNRKKHKQADYWSLDMRTETERYVPRLIAIATVLKNADTYDVSLRPIPNQAYFAKVDIQQQLDLAKAAELADMSMDAFYQLNPAFNQWATDPQGPHHLLVHSDKADGFTKRLSALPKNARVLWTRHKVAKGETLSHIARKHHVTVASIRQTNKLKNNRIRAGKHLLIPSSSKTPDHYSHSQTARLKAHQSKARRGQKTHYQVKSGDSLWTISRRHQVGIRQLTSWNKISTKDVLKPGQKLVIWKNNTKNKGVGTFKPLQTVHYTIRKGDSLYRISQKFDVSVADLKRWNRINSRYLQPGQRLKVIVDVTRS